MIMTTYQQDEGSITLKVEELQQVMVQTVALSSGIYFDTKTQIVPRANMSESEMIRYVVPQLFEMFNVVTYIKFFIDSN